MFHTSLVRLTVILTLGVLFTTSFFQNAAPASAATYGLNFNVNDTADLVDTRPGDGKCLTAHNTCTLRAAIMEANKHKGTDVINLQANATYTLTRVGDDDKAKKGDLDVTESIQLVGNGATIDGNGAVTHDRVFHFLPNQVQEQYSVLDHLTIQGGATSGDGGGIMNEGTVLLNYVTVKSNHADGSGGGVANRLNFIAFYSTFEFNTCGCASDQHPGGGGIFNQGAGALFGCTVNNNVSHRDGAGAWNEQSLVVVSSTFANNQADRSGGAIFNKGTMEIGYSTIAYNFADVVHNGMGYGGGIDNAPNATVNLGSTLLAKNVNMENGSYKWDDCHGALGSYGFNLIYYNNLCVVSASQNLIGFEPALGVFGANGGPTKTIPLKPGSWAIDNGNPTACQLKGASFPYDQRMYNRIADGNNDNNAICDIGAFEYNSTPYNDNCSGAPSNVAITSPDDKQKVKPTQVLVFISTDCADSYRLIVRQDSKQGPRVDQVKGLIFPAYLTTTLQKGHTYYVRARACNANGCTRSPWSSFTIKP